MELEEKTEGELLDPVRAFKDNINVV